MAFTADERLYLGAEAEVWRGSWMGLPAVRKQRRLRSWRHPDLDDRLGRRRMLAEARMVRLYRVDSTFQSCTIATSTANNSS